GVHRTGAVRFDLHHQRDRALDRLPQRRQELRPYEHDDPFRAADHDAARRRAAAALVPPDLHRHRRPGAGHRDPGGLRRPVDRLGDPAGIRPAPDDRLSLLPLPRRPALGDGPADDPDRHRRLRDRDVPPALTAVGGDQPRPGARGPGLSHTLRALDHRHVRHNRRRRRGRRAARDLRHRCGLVRVFLASPTPFAFWISVMSRIIAGAYSGGVSQATIGTSLITRWSSSISIPIGLFTAIFLVEYADQGWRRVLGKRATSLVDVMTGFPSIVAGLFGLALFIA